MAVAPPEEAGSKSEQPTLPANQSTSPKPNPSKQRGTGVTAAIFATVIIVFGLALIAVFAYLNQK